MEGPVLSEAVMKAHPAERMAAPQAPGPDLGGSTCSLGRLEGDKALGGVSGGRIHPYAHGEHRLAGVFSGISANFQENPLVFVSPVYNPLAIAPCSNQSTIVLGHGPAICKPQ